MTEPIYDYDPAQALDGPEAIAVFIADALDTETPPISLRLWEWLPAPRG
jgi:DNA-binding phage protein